MNLGYLKIALCSLVIGHFGTAPAVAQTTADYPSRLVRIIVPYPAGGGPDVFTRVVANRLSEKWKQSVVIENRVGGAGNIGAAQVARAEPDGYTLLASAPGPIAINGSLFKNLAYDPAKWSPVSILTRQAMPLAARKNLPANTVQEMISIAKHTPGKMSYASFGHGSMSQLTMIRFLAMAGVDMVHVPYPGSVAALSALMTDQVDIAFDNPVSYIPPFQDGRIKILAAGNTQRLSILPNTPTFAEAGFPTLQPYAWLAVVAPPDTPAPITHKISQAMAEILMEPEMKRRLEALLTEPVGSLPAQTGAFISSEASKWRDVIRSAQISVD